MLIEINHFTRLALMAITPLCAAGCLTAEKEAQPSASPKALNWTPPLSPEQVSGWSPEEAKAVLIAWSTVDRNAKNAGTAAPDIVSFRVTPCPEGWQVYVQFVGTYLGGKPVAAPGYFAVLTISRDWQVLRTAGGA
jgi:hypothetical protein